ncbi:MAG: chromosome segregation protein SMC [Clostridia bacterium]|nr:chromosome segregation protein SMC [Clostridia bacterium]
MRLKSVEINGFKSFPDRVEINFDSGIIAIVGPNGSGKSNVVDAVRWVLGEQSSKTLRGGKMEDVIFSGTQGRRAVGMAEVSLVIDNADGELPTPLTELKVTRRLYRSGESEYLMAGRSVRLRDIHELFMNTGIGRDGYSLIGQGKIAEVLSNRSEDRRAIFEEAAGISKFRYRRNESQRRLEATEDNLIRLREIQNGYAQRVGPLKQQSEKARKYLDYREEKKALEIDVWLEQLDQTKDRISRWQDNYLIATSQLEELTLRQQDVEQELDRLAERASRINLETDEALRSQRELEQQAAQAKSEAAVTENELAHNRQRQESLVESAALSKERLLALQARDVQMAEDQKRLTEQGSALRQQMEQLLLQAEDGSLKEVEQTIVRKRTEQFDLLDALGRNRAEAANCETALAAKKEEETQVEAELAALEKEISLAQQRLSETEALLKQQEESPQRAENSVGGYEKKHAVRMQRLQEERQALEDLTRKRMQTEQRLHALKELEQNLEGFSGAVKLILREKQHGRLAGVHGAVSSLIETEKRYALAIETALGGALQYLVVDTEQQAKAAIAMLKARNAGRATFLPLSAVQHRSGETPPREGEGIVGSAAELVSCDERYRPLIDTQLGRTLVVREIDHAISLAKQHRYRFRIVTLDGQLVNVGGSLTGGSAVRGAGMLSRRGEIEALAKQASDEQAEEEAAAVRVKAAQQEAAKVLAESQGAQAERQTAREEQIRLLGELSSARAALELLLRSREALFLRRDRAQEGQNEALASLEKVKRRQSELRLRQEEGAKLLSELEQSYEEQSEALNALMRRSSELRLALTACERDASTLEESRRETAELLALQGLDRDRLETELQALVQDRERLDQELASLRESALAHERQAAQRLAQMARLSEERDAAERTQVSLRTQERALAEQREGLVKEQMRCEAQKAQVEAERDALIGALWDEYELTASMALELRTPMADRAAAQRRIAELKHAIKALGHVNVDAIEEYKTVKEQFDYYTAQVGDLEVSKAELEKLIAQLTAEMQTIFKEQFHVIESYFKQIFSDLFGGGTASLSLSDPSDVLESNIELRVQPPGKIINNLSALSGGEQALTAIALYFAILRVHPSPFVILDEIDTALDEVNVVRLANYYKRFTEKTQLILVTHRRGVMEMADVLYGITMQEQGVSKILRIDVNDVERRIHLRAT